MLTSYNRLTQDVHLREVLTGASLALLLRGAGVAIAFALNVAIGRVLGAEDAGYYFLALSMVMIGSVFARLGLDNTLLRFIAAGAAKDEWGELRGVFSLGIKIAGGTSFALSLFLSIGAPWIAVHIFDKQGIIEPLRWMSFGIFTFSVMMLLAESLRGLNRIRDSMLVSGVIFPLISLILLWPLTSRWGVAGASISYVLSTGIAGIYGMFQWNRATKGRAAPEPFPLKPVWDSAHPLWLMSLIRLGLMPWAPLFLLGIWGPGADSAGVFGAVTRVAMLVTFLFIATNTAIASKISKLLKAERIDELRDLSRKVSAIVTIASTPILLFLIFKGDFVMLLFGRDYSTGATALAILSIGHLIISATGLGGTILVMSGRENYVRRSAVVSTFILFALAFLTIPTLGIVGAALATAGSMAFMSGLEAYFVWKIFGFSPVMKVPLVGAHT